MSLNKFVLLDRSSTLNRSGVKAKATVKHWASKLARLAPIPQEVTPQEGVKKVWDLQDLPCNFLPLMTFNRGEVVAMTSPATKPQKHDVLLRKLYSMTLRQQRKFLDALHADQEAKKELRNILPTLSRSGIEGEVRNILN